MTHIIDGLAEGQVLQRNGSRGARLAISGATSRESGIVLATISKSRRALKNWKERPVGKSAQGKFTARFDGIPAGGPYRLELRLKGGPALGVVKSFFAGDVWVLAGQSNMEGYGSGRDIAKPHPLIQVFSMRRQWRRAIEPLHVLEESPDPCHSARQCSREMGEALRRNAAKGAGPGLFFAREMLKRSGVPQGLICAAHGGTSMRQWNPELQDQGGASLYASLLASVRATGQPVAGMLWYQGESDSNPEDALLYMERMQRLVAAARRDLRQPSLPSIMVQISRIFGANAAWNLVQEAQRLLPDKIRYLETVSAIDLPFYDGIHIDSTGYPRLAARLGRAAARLVHGNRKEQRPPRPKSISKVRYVRPIGYVLDVTFDGVKGGLQSAGEPQGFSILDDKGREMAIYRTSLHGPVARLGVRVTDIHGLQLSYGRGPSPICNITDGRDEALLAFGPIPLDKPAALLPFIRTWKASDVVPAVKSLARITASDLETHDSAVKTYETDFVDEHSRWEGLQGHVFFHSRIELPEPMRLEALMGYDGPFRLWVDGKAIFQDLQGTNPGIPDEKRRMLSLEAGTHELRVAMDTNNGRACGFFLRFRRADVSRAQIASGDYARPTHAAG